MHKLSSNKIIYLGEQKMFHATTEACANSIFEDFSLCKGRSGMFGGGIYFAIDPEIARHKCSIEPEVYIECIVDFGYAMVLEHPDSSINLHQLKKYGCNSVKGRRNENTNWEYIVYETHRVKPTRCYMYEDYEFRKRAPFMVTSCNIC